MIFLCKNNFSEDNTIYIGLLLRYHWFLQLHIPIEKDKDGFCILRFSAHQNKSITDSVQLFGSTEAIKL